MLPGDMDASSGTTFFNVIVHENELPVFNQDSSLGPAERRGKQNFSSWMFSTVFFLFYLPSASTEAQTGLNLSEVLGLSPSQLLACLLVFWAGLSLFYGLLWVIHQLLPYSSVNLLYLVKSSLIFFLYSFYLCCYFRGILGKPAREHIHQGHDESCLELFWPHVFVSPPKSTHVLLWCPQPEPQRPSRYHYLNMQSTLSFIPSEETILPRTEIPTTRKKRQFDIFLTVWKFLEPKKPFILHSGSYWIKAGGKKPIHSPYAAW